MRATALAQPRPGHSYGKLAEAAGRRQGRGGLGNARRDHLAARLQGVRLRYPIHIRLQECGITTSAASGAAAGLPAEKAIHLRTRRKGREGDTTG